MKLYRTASGVFQVPGKQDRKAERIEVPTDSAGLCDFLNAAIPASSNDNETHAFRLGRSDAERGMTANPYGSPDLRAEWEAGHAFAVESGMASLSSFATRAGPRNGKRKGR